VIGLIAGGLTFLLNYLGYRKRLPTPSWNEGSCPGRLAHTIRK
jgi:hypothetical protein